MEEQNEEQNSPNERTANDDDDGSHAQWVNASAMKWTESGQPKSQNLQKQ